MNLLSNHGISKRPSTSKENSSSNTSLKEHPGFENDLNFPNQKLCHTITKLSISAHKFSIEMGRFEYRK